MVLTQILQKVSQIDQLVSGHQMAHKFFKFPKNIFLKFFVWGRRLKYARWHTLTLDRWGLQPGSPQRHYLEIVPPSITSKKVPLV
jgi:hypothetical protein